MPSLCYQGAYQGSFGGRPIERPKLRLYSAGRAHTHSYMAPTYFCFGDLFARTHTCLPSFLSHQHHISLHSLLQWYAVLVSSLNRHIHRLSPGPDYDTVGWDRRKTLWPCLIKMVKSWRWIGWLILPQVPSQSPHLLV